MQLVNELVMPIIIEATTSGYFVEFGKLNPELNKSKYTTDGCETL